MSTADRETRISTPTLRFLSLFSGVGGFDLALERNGFACVGQIEIDPYCTRVLERHWPHVQRWADVRDFWIRQVQPSNIPSLTNCPPICRGRQFASPLDLLCGGWPCQDLSMAGKRAGLSGARSGLFYEILRIAKETRPNWGLFEIVPGLFSSRNGEDFATVLNGLRECWPVVGYRVLDAQYFGVPQRRRRLFFVCGPTEHGVTEILFKSEGGARNFAAGGKAGQIVPALISSGSPGTRREDELSLVIFQPKASSTQSMNPSSIAPMMGVTKELAVASPLTASYGKQIDSSDRNGGPPNLLLLANSLNAKSGGNQIEENYLPQAMGTTKELTVLLQTNTLTLQGFSLIIEAYANATQTGPEEVLQFLQKTATSKKAAQWGFGVIAPFWTPEVLQSDLHGPSVRRQAEQNGSMVSSSLPRSETCSKRAVQQVRQAEREGCSPQGRKSSQQRPEESRENLPILSQPRTSPEETLHDLWQTSEGARILQQALHQIQKVWRPAHLQNSATQEMSHLPRAVPGEEPLREALHGKETSRTSSPYLGVRRITVVEAERLQGFPDGFSCVCGAHENLAACRCPDSPRYRALGNAVAIPVVAWIAGRLAVHMHQEAA